MSAIPYVTDEAAFDAEINGELPVLVNFTASWCGPCKQMAPVLEEVASDLEASMKIVKIDVDEAKEIAGRYTIQGVPTFMLFQQGEVLATVVGARPKRELLDELEPLL